MEALEAPKTGVLAPVLATLQPEQYRLVTWPHDRNLVVQGHPGTGKTIVAAHRAAYLALPKDDRSVSPRLNGVALVGPSDRWKRHIELSVNELAGKKVEVLSLESLIYGWADVPHRSHHPTDERWFHSVWEIGRIVDRAWRSQRDNLRKLSSKERSRQLVKDLINDTETHRRFVSDDQKEVELKQWLLTAPKHGNARRDSSYLLFLAAIGVTVGLGHQAKYQHIVVDEAQDIRPVEWWMLDQMFRVGTEARWSLLGDLNQRRSDFTWTTWKELTDSLELAEMDEDQMPIEELDSGYRSTSEILRYADALLPKRKRGGVALRSGPVPSVRRVGRNQLLTEAAVEAKKFIASYPQGSVAIIVCDKEKVEKIEQSFKKEGWLLQVGDRVLVRDSCDTRVTVSPPVWVRGLEFDAVVVVEPADFRSNVGRAGELYTSLTRANCELAVIHSKAMPSQLKGRGRRIK